MYKPSSVCSCCTLSCRTGFQPNRFLVNSWSVDHAKYQTILSLNFSIEKGSNFHIIKTDCMNQTKPKSADPACNAFFCILDRTQNKETSRRGLSRSKSFCDMTYCVVVH